MRNSAQLPIRVPKRKVSAPGSSRLTAAPGRKDRESVRVLVLEFPRFLRGRLNLVLMRALPRRQITVQFRDVLEDGDARQRSYYVKDLPNLRLQVHERDLAATLLELF